MSTYEALTVERPGSSGYRLDDQVGHLLRRAYQVASANLMARMPDDGLTPVQFAVLARLHEHGPVSQNRLGRLVAMEPANIHGLVRRLSGRGLVRVDADSHDRRRLLVSLTAAGQALVESLFPVSETAGATTLAPLSGDERETLLDLLRRIGTTPR